MNVLLVTLHSQNNNFGSVLQAHSLYYYLVEMGLDVTVLDYRPYYSNGARDRKSAIKKAIVNTAFLPQYILRSARFSKLINKEKLTRRCTEYSEIKSIASDFDVFMVGSDQVWNPHYLCGKDPTYFLSFTDSPNKISYASSIGTSSISEEEIKNIINNTRQFKSVSLRETESVLLLHRFGDDRPKYVLDPVFLHDVSFYRNIQSNVSETGYILAYIMQKDPFISEVTAAIAKKLNKRVIQIGGFASKCACDKFPRAAGPAEFLALIDGADFVVTSSFHGTSFSHIYHKQFAVVLPDGNTMRIRDILKTAGTENRIIKSLDDISIVDQKIDYDEVQKRIDSMRQQSYDFLNQAFAQFR
jgi:hypothetical protein